jgi:hypothetical protein
MACWRRAAAVSAVMLLFAVAGCASASTHTAQEPGEKPAPSGVRPGSPAKKPLLTGARLSSLIPTPAGFTLNRSSSFDSGTREAIPVPGPSSTTGVDCASWESGEAYLGPGTIGYAVKNYTGPGQIILHTDVNLYPAGTGSGVFDSSMAIQRRCSHFTYVDKDDLLYAVSAAVGPSAGIGDRSAEVNATLTALDGAVFTSQTTYIVVGDAMATVTETGPAGAPVNRAVLPLAAIVAALRSAGY